MKKRMMALSVNLDEDAIEKLNEVARKEYIKPRTLARTLIMKGLEGK
jgi:predicted transcriptional regulator